MRATPFVLAAALFLLPFAPLASATPTCQTLDRVAGPTHVHTETCSDNQSWFGYTFLLWWNQTYVQANGAAGGAIVLDSNAHYVVFDPSGVEIASNQVHSYQVGATPTSNPAVSYAVLGASDYQSTYGSSCYETAGAGGWSSGALQQNGVGQNVFMGGASPLPCTDEGTQETLP